ncbi:aldehyde dehydrogenase family protein [Verticiella sediminum]|uniref:Aldehyde dehydrogenase family protein n=1 Tax=Verticiella sediminum TaxID=1247510 RepID=A0A556B232_9BURK|nr:aldehyde dehydrogenase family protein [Verticiella sediminum]TSH99222.1 aldehyde dehydrogenase family protein [Verticiella sediminum]
MREDTQFFIDGKWVDADADAKRLAVINPATGEEAGSVRQAGEADVNRAIEAARRAFRGFSRTLLHERLELLDEICVEYEKRMGDLADAITEEMGAPHKKVAVAQQVPIGIAHLKTARRIAADFPFEEHLGRTLIVKEPVGVCALITPWNWPLNQITCKVAPALVTGCTMVLKPSELAPFSARIFAEILEHSGVPAGVFNMVHGDGAIVGPWMSSHPQVDMVSLTGSARAGASVSKNAADSIKVVSLELGGKSANVILPGADLKRAVAHGVVAMMNNTGQSCNAPSRMLVPAERIDEVEAIAVAALERVTVGDPRDEATTVGPIANARQYERVQTLIQKGIDEGAKLLAGGTGRPEGIERGYFARPTIFSRANNRMTIAQEEIFGPVLTIIPYRDVDEAIDIANDTTYGLSGYVYGETLDQAREVARQLRTGMVHLNGAPGDPSAPFGGYKQSGVGREWGEYGIEEFLETKAIMGSQSA